MKSGQKKRLQFAEKETGAADLEKKAEKVVSPEKKKAKAHSNREQVFTQPAEDTGKKKRLHFEGENSTKEPVKTMTGNAARGATAAVRRKLAESEDDNAAVQGVLEVEQNAERSVRLAQASVRSRQRRKNRTARRLERKTDRVEVQKRYRDLLSKDEKLQRSSQIKKQIFRLPAFLQRKGGLFPLAVQAVKAQRSRPRREQGGEERGGRRLRKARKDDEQHQKGGESGEKRVEKHGKQHSFHFFLLVVYRIDLLLP